MTNQALELLLFNEKIKVEMRNNLSIRKKDFTFNKLNTKSFQGNT